MDHSLYALQLLGLGGVAGVLPLYIGIAISFLLLQMIQPPYKILIQGFAIGILCYLFFEVMHEAVEFTGATDPVSWIVLVGSFSISVVGLSFLEQYLHRSQTLSASSSLFVPYMIALGLGLHNLGEGLAIGSSYAQERWVLSSLLIGGFTLHNATEGLAVMSPQGSHHYKARHMTLLGLLAGGPTCLGTLISGYLLSPYLFITFYAVAAGSLLYVITALLSHSQVSTLRLSLSIGLASGLSIMYLTGMMLALLLGFRS
ncbi:MAG: zinc transporter ZupT [Nitrospirae bacterium]|nr:MAG: zinc transporter ZupT [Nitrospirota bacterium]